MSSLAKNKLLRDRRVFNPTFDIIDSFGIGISLRERKSGSTDCRTT